MTGSASEPGIQTGSLDSGFAQTRPRNDGIEPYPIALQAPVGLRQAVPRAISSWPLTVTEWE